MKIKDILAEVPENSENIFINYRTYGPDGEDILAGACEYKDNILCSCDGDIYSLTDKIINYEWVNYNEVTIWYESQWV